MPRHAGVWETAPSGRDASMTERTDDTQRPDDAQRAPSDPPEDPKTHPQPPSNPDVDQEDVDRGEDQLERISGN